ncbi:Ion_trans_2 domain-containing protein [Meloidogyne graminicola]|uniref:Ion_trans_2 domain-containing protein n=1 Tax=Meloidogyne graminicola TaxID=189291 RepID=A0A8S9ZFN3_9BILA|nr:Ion_trans_2 domain-containing protein [Meloidogyne graminicola]
MQLRAFFHRHSKNATPIAVHMFMFFGVTLYILFGALIIQKIESNGQEASKHVQHQKFYNSISYMPDQKESIINDHKIIMESTSKHKMRHGLKHKRDNQQNNCLSQILEYFHKQTCNSTMVITVLESFYKNTLNEEAKLNASLQRFGWSFSDSVLFCFTVITTIGYGNVSPKTNTGQLFCIIYALFGIPFTLLAIADLGKFISEVMETWEENYLIIRKKVTRIIRQLRGRPKFSIINLDNNNNQAKNNHIIITTNQNMTDQICNIDCMNNNIIENRRIDKNSVNNEEADKDDEPNFKNSQAITLFLFFLFYVLIGACIMPFYEPDMAFFKAIYFNFVSLTSIGLGDIIPQSESYMAFTLIYIAVGLAITTIAIEIAADYLKKLHYFGRKIENVGNVVIWFGGKKLTMKQLVKNLGDQFNLPVNAVKTLDLDKFVDDAIKVEEGELNTLRAPPIEPKDLLEEGTLNYADDDNGAEGNWIRQRTPSTSPEPELTTEFHQETKNDQEPESEDERPDSEKNENDLTNDSNNPEKEMEENREITIDVRLLDNDQPSRTELLPSKCDVDESFTSENGERRKSNYSEEAWRRYLAYQKQWRKYRQTKTAGLNNPTELQYSKKMVTGGVRSNRDGSSKQEISVPQGVNYNRAPARISKNK